MTKLLESLFEFRDQVAGGANGEILLGLDRQTHHSVVIKRLRLRGDDPAEVERFRQEADILQQIDSPYIVKLLDYGLDAEGRECIVLERLEGMNLTEWRTVYRAAEQQICRIGAQIARGLDALHRALIIHRDIKPSNIFVTQNSTGKLQAKILDLGAAKRLDIEPLTGGTFVVLGTPAYMAPEQARAASVVSVQSDIFALGLVLFELAMGRRAFEGPPDVITARLLLGEIPRIALGTRGLSNELIALINRALSREPELRFDSALAMGNELEALLNAGALSAERPALERAGGPRSVMPPPPESDASDEPIAVTEKRVISAVFASFTPLIDPQLDPANYALTSAMADFESIATAQGADVATMVGNRAVAVYGFRESSSDDLVRAARTALQVRQQHEKAGLVLVTVRALNDSHTIPTTVIERAMSMLGEQIAGVVVDDITATLLEGHFELQTVADRRVLVSERQADLDRSPPLLGRITPTVGRERELRLLDGILQDCVADHQAQAVLLTGDAGIGKSRLRRTWIEKLVTESPPVWVNASKSIDWSELVIVAHSDPMGAEVSLNVLGQLIRHAAGIKAKDAEKFQQHKLRKRLARVFSEEVLDNVGPFLAEIAGIRWGGPVSSVMLAARMNPSLMGDRVRLAWLDWIAAECAQHPLVLVIEDMQWADEASVLLLDATLSLCAKHSLMVLAFARPEVQKAFPKLWASRGALSVALSELTPKAATELVRGCLSTEVSDRVVELIVTRAGGNAFFLEELIRAEHQRRASGRVDGQLAMPESLLAQVQVRLQSLSNIERRVLRVASVFGEQFWAAPITELLHDCHELDFRIAIEIRRALAALEAQELLRRSREDRFAKHEQYAFRQRMIRDAAYDMLTPEDRAATHQWVAEWLLTVGERDVSRIAEHFLLGLDTKLAAKYLTDAAELALEATDLPGAIAFSSKAIACGVDVELLGRLELVRAEAFRWRGENRLSLTAALSALSALRQGSESWFRAAKEAVHTSGRLLENDTLVRVGEALAQERGELMSYAEVAACARAAECLTHSGYPVLAEKLFSKVTSTSGQVDLEDPWVQAAIDGLRGGRELTAGALGAAAQSFQRTIAMYEALGDMRNATIYRLNAGFTLGQLGDYDRAEEAFRTARVHAEKLGLLDLITGIEYNLGFVLGRLGRVDEALAFGHRALTDFSAQGNRLLASMSKVYMADALYWAGDYQAAAGLASEAMGDGVDGPFLAAALAIASGAYLVLGDAPKALALGERGIELLESIGGINTLELFLRLAHVEALFANGHAVRGETYLRAAIERFTFRLDSLLDEAQKERYRTVPPEHQRLLRLAEHYLRDTLENLG